MAVSGISSHNIIMCRGRWKNKHIHIREGWDLRGTSEIKK